MGPILGVDAKGQEQPFRITADGKLTVNATISSDTWGADVLAALNKLANSPSVSWDQATNYSALPDPSTASGETWLVLSGTGIWPNNKPSGWYYSDGNGWAYLGAYNPIVTGGNVVVTNFPSVQPVSGPLTDDQLRATPVPVEGNLELSGSVSIGNFPSVQPVSGPLTDAQLRATPVPISGDLSLSGSVDVGNFPATQAVSGSVAVTNFPATQPVSGTVSVSGTVPVSGAVSVSNLPATQPISGAVSVSNFPASQAVTGTFWQGTQPVSGPLTDTQLRASAVPVSGTFFQVTQPVSGTVSVGNFPATQPVSGTVTVTQGTLTKGTQGSTGVSTQDLKDAGRSYLSFTANAIAGVTGEALVSFTQNKQGTNTSSVTSYTITSGKTLRITSIAVGLKSAAAAIAFAKVILRHNTAGATTASSPIAYLVPEINTNSATSGTGAFIQIPIYDGLEFVGNGTQTIGVSHLDQATTNILNITVLGFEY